MKVQIKAASTWDFNNKVIIEVNTIDEAINRIQTDKNLVLSIIGTNSSIYNKVYNIYTIPKSFIVDIIKNKDYDISITLYDDYIE